MNRNQEYRGVASMAVAGCLLSGLAAWPATACDDGKARRAAVSPALAQAIAQLRAEQRMQVQQAARTGLAQLRSETATALAQGATAAGNTAVQTAP